MKIDTAGLNKFLFIFILYTGCVHSNSKTAEVTDYYKKINLVVNDIELKNGNIIDSGINQLIYKPNSNHFVKIYKSSFQSEKESLTHLMSRQVAISALFRDLFEPYYGLVQKKKCVDLVQFNTDLISINESSKYFSFIIPVDSYFNPFDCDLGEPSLYAKYTFLYCSKEQTIFEIRQYRPTSEKFNTENVFSCGESSRED